MRALLLLLTIGCAHRGGLPMPGPLSTLGEEVGRDEAGLARRAPEKPQEAPKTRAEKRKQKAVAAAHDGMQVAIAASGMVGKGKLVVNGRTYRYDCSGLVSAAYARAGRQLDGSSEDLYNLAKDEGVLHKKKTPQPGDVAFFDDTWDRNGNGRRDDDLTHVAVVEKIEPDGTIILIHKGSKGVVRIRMNLHDPDVERNEQGVVLNDGLRSGKDDGGDRLTGELWKAFGSFWELPAEPPSQGGVAER